MEEELDGQGHVPVVTVSRGYCHHGLNWVGGRGGGSPVDSSPLSGTGLGSVDEGNVTGLSHYRPKVSGKPGKLLFMI